MGSADEGFQVFWGGSNKGNRVGKMIGVQQEQVRKTKKTGVNGRAILSHLKPI